MWKKFDFFTSELLQSESPSSSLFTLQVLDFWQHANVQAMDITCVTGGLGQLVFGDSEGGDTISNQNYSLSRFKAHDGCINGAVLVGFVFSR